MRRFIFFFFRRRNGSYWKRQVLQIGLLVFAVTGCALAPPGVYAAAPSNIQISVLYDAFGKRSQMVKDWGYAALIEVNGKRILFDTGDDAEIFAQNVKTMGVDLTKLNFVVISHRHGDHIGGLAYLLHVNPAVKIYAPKENFGVFGFSLPSSFYRRAESLPAEMRYYDGAPPPVMRFGNAWPGATFELIEKTTEIAPGIHLIALVSDKPNTLELRELSLAIETPDGLVLVVGCSHPGIEKIVESASTIDKHIRLIAGGFHLVVAKDPEIEHVAMALRDTYNVDYIAPGHCTGEQTFVALQQVFAGRYLYAGVGSVVNLGILPLAESQALPPAMDVSELRTYRTLARLREPGDPIGGELHASPVIRIVALNFQWQDAVDHVQDMSLRL